MLHDFVYFDKRTGQITGHFRTSTPELLPTLFSPDQGQVEVTDTKHRTLLAELSSRKAKVDGTVHDGRVSVLNAVPRYKGAIKVTCDLPDLDGDGVAELPSDGKAVARVKVTVLGIDERPLKDPVVVHFQTNRGLLSHRRVSTKDGAAEVELRSLTETVRIHLAVTADGFDRVTLALETIPIEEHQALAAARSSKRGG